MSDFPSFDELKKIAKEDPERLEQIRKDACEDLIQNAPQNIQRQLRGLQFKIDMERRRSKTPLASCIKLSSMMHDSFAKLRDALQQIQGVNGSVSIKEKPTTTATKESGQNKSEKKPTKAKVIHFPQSATLETQ